MTIASSSAAPAPRSALFERLIETARPRPEAVALRHKIRGAWVAWSWRSVVDEADRLAAALREIGVAPGDAVGFSGELRPNLVLASLAARIAGAAIVSVPPGAKPARIAERLEKLPLRAIVVQGREALANWLEARSAAGRDLRIVFDHVTPDGRSPHGSILTFGQFRSLAEPLGWATTIEGVASGDGRRSAVVWVEETTDWPDALPTLLDAWITSGQALAFPELLAAAPRDRHEIQPARWIASPARVRRVVAEIEARLPALESPTGRFVRWALGSKSDRPASRPILGRLVAAPLRRHLGLSALSGIEAGGDGALPAITSPSTQLLAALGVPARPVATGRLDDAGSAPLVGTGDFALAGGRR